MKVQEGDPQIYVKVEESLDTSPYKSVFVLSNHGGGIAKNVRLNTLKLKCGIVEFDTVDHLPSGERAEITPTAVPTVGVLNDFPMALLNHHIGYLLHREWDVLGEEPITGDFVRSMRVAYENFQNRAFETTFDLVFHPIVFQLRGSRNSKELRTRPAFEVTNTNIQAARVSSLMFLDD